MIPKCSILIMALLFVPVSCKRCTYNSAEMMVIGLCSAGEADIVKNHPSCVGGVHGKCTIHHAVRLNAIRLLDGTCYGHSCYNPKKTIGQISPGIASASHVTALLEQSPPPTAGHEAVCAWVCGAKFEKIE